MKLLQLSALVGLSAILTNTIASPIINPLTSRAPERALDNVLAPGGCQQGPNTELCILTTITRPSKSASVYLQDNYCRLIGYEPNVPLDQEILFHSELGEPFKFVLRDGGRQPWWAYDGRVNGIGTEKAKNRYCRVDENGEMGCSIGWKCRGSDGTFGSDHLKMN